MKTRHFVSCSTVLLTLVLASCGDSKTASTTTAESTTTAAPTTVAPETTAAPTTAAPETTAAPTTATVSTIADIPAVEDRIPLLENADQLATTINQALASPMLKQVSAEVTAVAFESETRALVTYDILLSASPVMKAAQGVAVKVGDKWQGKAAKDGVLHLALAMNPEYLKMSSGTYEVTIEVSPEGE